MVVYMEPLGYDRLGGVGPRLASARAAGGFGPALPGGLHAQARFFRASGLGFRV